MTQQLALQGTGADRRAFGRRPTNLHAVIHIPRRPPIRCVVKDISEGGALLELAGAASLPMRISLVWDGSGVEARCEVRHVSGTRVGVQFICDNGRHVAKETIAVAESTSAAPLPELRRDEVFKSNTDELNRYIQNFRKARLANATVAVATAITGAAVSPELASNAGMPPLPAPASAYAI